jgi:hypothetical protein
MPLFVISVPFLFYSLSLSLVPSPHISLCLIWLNFIVLLSLLCLCIDEGKSIAP